MDRRGAGGGCKPCGPAARRGRRGGPDPSSSTSSCRTGPSRSGDVAEHPHATRGSGRCQRIPEILAAPVMRHVDRIESPLIRAGRRFGLVRERAGGSHRPRMRVSSTEIQQCTVRQVPSIGAHVGRRCQGILAGNRSRPMCRCDQSMVILKCCNTFHPRRDSTGIVSGLGRTMSMRPSMICHWPSS